MPEWNALFLDPRHVQDVPQPELEKTLKILERRFPERPLRVWDVCCGAGRHLPLIAARGHEAYGSDISENAVRLSRERMARTGLRARVERADMTENPWGGLRFHAAFSWNSLHHNTLGNVRRAIAVVREALVPGGLFCLNLLSDSGDFYGHGEMLEKGTYRRTDGRESGVVHHYFSEEEVRASFDGFELEVLLDIPSRRLVVAEELREAHPFVDSKWGILARRL